MKLLERMVRLVFVFVSEKAEKSAVEAAVVEAR